MKPVLSLLLLLIVFQSSAATPLCSTCRWTIDALYNLLVNPALVNTLLPIANFVCKLVKPESFCRSKLPRVAGLVPAIAVMFNSTALCSRLSLCYSPQIVPDLEERFVNRVLRDRPPIKPYESKKSPLPPLKVLAFTDMHLDFDYIEGKSTVCDFGLCCRRSSPDTNITSRKAGRYGSYGCDLPNITAESFVDEVAKINPDLIVWMGDNPPHNMYEQRQETQVGYFRFMAQLLKKKFPGKVYPVLGNHDSFPEAQFDPREAYPGHKWLTEGYASEMESWLDAEALKSMQKYGYYAQVHPKTKLKVIGLNTFLMDFNNVYLWGNATNPMGSMGWLESQLASSESKGEAVVLIGHIASQSNSGVYSWTYRYTALMERYANIVKGQFFGHIHNDLFFVSRSHYNRSLPFAVTHVLPSLTPDPNPSFRVYYMDRESYRLLDYDQYRLYLAESNRLLKPIWRIAYHFLSYFNVPDMSPKSFAEVIARMQSSLEYFRHVYTMYTNEGSSGLPEEFTRRKLLCSFTTWNMYEHRTCLSAVMGQSYYDGYYFPNQHVIPDWLYAQPISLQQVLS